MEGTKQGQQQDETDTEPGHEDKKRNTKQPAEQKQQNRRNKAAFIHTKPTTQL